MWNKRDQMQKFILNENGDFHFFFLHINSNAFNFIPTKIAHNKIRCLLFAGKIQNCCLPFLNELEIVKYSQFDMVRNFRQLQRGHWIESKEGGTKNRLDD